MRPRCVPCRRWANFLHGRGAIVDAMLIFRWVTRMLLVSRLLCWKCHRLLQSQPPSHQPRQGDSRYMRMPLASIMMASQEKSAWTRWRPQARNRGRPTAGQNTTFTVTFQVTTSRKCRARELVSPSTFVPTLSHFAGQADSTEDRDRMAGLGEAASLAICWNNPDHFLALFSIRSHPTINNAVSSV
jgi:hypothetical protein